MLSQTLSTWVPSNHSVTFVLSSSLPHTSLAYGFLCVHTQRRSGKCHSMAPISSPHKSNKHPSIVPPPSLIGVTISLTNLSSNVSARECRHDSFVTVSLVLRRQTVSTAVAIASFREEAAPTAHNNKNESHRILTGGDLPWDHHLPPKTAPNSYVT